MTLPFTFCVIRSCVKRFISCYDGKSYIILGVGIFLNYFSRSLFFFFDIFFAGYEELRVNMLLSVTFLSSCQDLNCLCEVCVNNSKW